MEQSEAYALRKQILSIQASLSAAMAAYHISRATLSVLGYHTLLNPLMRQAAALNNPALTRAFSLYKRLWGCFLEHCCRCIDLVWQAVTWKEEEAGFLDRVESERLEAGSGDMEEMFGLGEEVGRAREGFEEEVGVLGFEMEMLEGCYGMVGREWKRVEGMARGAVEREG
jgi:hypothetical protein